MKNYKKIISTLLAVIMMLGAFAGFTLNVSAADDKEDDMTRGEKIESIYHGQTFNTPEEKLATMTKMLEKNGVELWIDSISGEVATRDQATGAILFSNPYDMNGTDMDVQTKSNRNGSLTTQKEILSQLVVQYKANDGNDKMLYSFEEAAMREQIKVIKIKNGLRVEYTIGREETRKLVPRLITKENFEKFIELPLKEAITNGAISQFDYDKLVVGYYTLITKKGQTERQIENLIKKYPIMKDMSEDDGLYECATDITPLELSKLESMIKEICVDYTFEQMDADHEETGYVGTDTQYPVFKMALEYSIDENGALIVRMPCNGLRYDMSAYTLESLSILPYMGAGNGKNPGYNFFPDGAGSLFDFEQLSTKQTVNVRGKVYGNDYAYHQLTGTYQKTLRYPVYGSVATEVIYSFTTADEVGGTINWEVSNTVIDPTDEEAFQKWLDWTGKWTDANGVTHEKKAMTLISEVTKRTYQRGYVAVIEEGDSLAEIATYHAGSTSPYHTMMNYFNPKPKDSYNITGALSVSGNASTWTVVSDRKYTGSITISYTMLNDVEQGEEAQKKDPTYKYYEPTWLGMAEAYRDSLVADGTLQKLSEQDTATDMPLFIETFGAMETQQVIASIPMDVMTPLTTFENVLTMYNGLSSAGVKNINFKLTGYANGGMYYTVPSTLKWEKSVGGKKGLETLIAEAKKINEKGDGSNLGLYPDFDFAYIQMNTLFDKTNMKDDAVKTIDNRYTSFRQYSATWQSYVSFYQLAVSPARYSKFYEMLLENYKDYGLTSMSLSTLGHTLNSDFDEDEPYNREDNKEFTMQAFADLQKAGYSLMTDSGNAYTWAYVDYLINMDLDSSRFIKSSASVPFIGAVLHGYIEFAGTPFNEEGDTDYAILRAIENGAGLYFILSYQNTNELKEDSYLSQYYSVRYDIWEEDIVSYYKKLNGLLKDVQGKVIVEHRFLEGERVLDKDELLNEIEANLEQAIKDELAKQEAIKNEQVVAVGDAWNFALNAKSELETLVEEVKARNEEITTTYNRVISMVHMDNYMQNVYNLVLSEICGVFNPEENSDYVHDPSIDMTEYEALAQEKLQDYIDRVKATAADVKELLVTQEHAIDRVNEVLDGIDAAIAVINASDMSAEVKADLTGYMTECKTKASDYVYNEAGINALIKEKTDLWEGTNNVATIALGLKKTIDEASTRYMAFQEFIPTINAGFARCTFYTVEDIEAAVMPYTPPVKDEDKNENTSSESVYNKYHVDNNRIVAVTYGDRDDVTGNKTDYKTFILNYNTYAVVVEYEQVKYTIPSGGYIVLYD